MTTTVSVPVAGFTRRRRQVVVAIVATVAMTALGSCTAGPVAFGEIPLSGTAIYNVNVQACAPRAGALRITADYYEISPDVVQLKIDRWAPTTGPVSISTWANDGLHWEFTTPPVAAGDCMHFLINSVEACCDPAEPPYRFPFDYRIEYLD